MRKTLPHIAAFLGFMISLSSFAQNNCASPTAIASLPYSSPTGLIGKHSTCGKVADYDEFDACGNRFIRSESYVYKFTAGATNTCINLALSATISLGGTSMPGLFLFDGCPDVATTNCVAQGINTTTGTGTKNVNLSNVEIIPGTVYYVVVSADTGCYTYTLSITNGSCGPRDTVGSGCADAKVIPALPYSTNAAYAFTTCGKGRTYNEGNPCQSYFMSGESFTFKYTSPVNQCAIIDVATESQDASLYIMENCPTSGDAICMASQQGSWNRTMSLFVSFEAGKDYYFIISSYNISDPCHAFDISVKPITLSGRTCTDAIDVPTLPFKLAGETTRCKGNDYNSSMANGSAYINGNEAVYKYVSPGNECLAVALNNMSTTGGLYVFNGCPGAAGTTLMASDSSMYVYTPTYGYEKTIDVQVEITTPGTYYIIASNPYPYVGNDTDYDIVIARNAKDDDGAKCETAYEIDSLNYSRTNNNTSCKGADYVGSSGCSDIGSRGNDLVYKITADRDGCAKVLAKNISGQLGMYLLSACPNDPSVACLNSVLCENPGCDSISFEYTFEKNKVYYLVTSAASGKTFTSFDLEIRPYAETTDTCLVCSEYTCKACKNISFELGDFSGGWEGFTGTFANPKLTPGISTGTINNRTSRHTIVSAGGYDPIVGPELSLVSPYGGNYAARLGNSLVGAEAEVLRYTYIVDSNTNNFYYYYAVILEDIGHLPADQPYFQTNVIVGGTEVITCGYYEVRAAANVPGFKPVKNSLANWKNWSLASIPLVNYVGQTVTIEFTTKDCSQSGHFGYAYIDAFCGKAEILKGDKEGRPIAVEGNVGYLCKDSTINLTAPGGYAKYQWSTGDTTQVIHIDTAGEYTVKVTSVSGCVAEIVTVIKPAEPPIAQFDFEQICSDTRLSFEDNSTSTDTFNIVGRQWYFGDGDTSTATDPTHVFPGPGTYNVKLVVTTAANCIDITTETVIVEAPKPIPPIDAIDSIVVCTKDSIHLFSKDVGADSHKWEGPKSFTSPLFSPGIGNADTLMTGKYYIIEDFGDCPGKKDSTYVTVLPFPNYSVTKDTTVCFSYTGIMLNATGGQSYNWSPPYMLDKTTGPSVKTTTDTTTQYSVLIQNAVCPDSLMKVKVTVDDYTVPLDADNYHSVCLGGTVVSKALGKPNKFFEWTLLSGGIVKDSTLTLATNNVNQTGYYVVNAYLGPNKYCKYGTDSTLIRVHPLPVPSINPPTNSVCYGDSAFAMASGAATYEWKDGSTVASALANLRVKNLATKIYVLNATSDSGCVASMNYTITVKPNFNVDLGPDRIACLGDTLLLDLKAPDFNQQTASFNWSNGKTDSTLKVWQTGTYYVDVLINGCLKTDTIFANFQQPGSFSIGPDQKICSTDSFLVDLSGVTGTVTWTDGYPNAKRYLKDPGGDFGVIVQLGTCTLTDTINIQSQQQHSVNIGPDSTVCLGKTITSFSPYPNDINVWKDGTTTNSSSFFTVSSAGTHQVILNVTVGLCTNADTSLLTIQTPPAFTLGPDKTVCQNVVVKLDAKLSGASSYLWNTGATADSLMVSTAGIYDVSVVSGACTVKDTIIVNHDSIPTFTLGPDQVLCQGQSTTLSTSVVGNSFLWNTGATSNSITVTTTGNYSLLVQRGLCSYTDQILVTFNTPPVVDLGQNFIVCGTVDTLLTATKPNSTYLWNTGATTDTLRATQAGTYSVVVTQGPCTGSGQITIQTQTPHTVTLPPDKILCVGVLDNIQSTTTAANPSYLWNTGATTSAINVSTTNHYILVVNDGVCTATDTTYYQFVAPPSTDLGTDTLFCKGDTITLNATYPGSTYLWNTGDVTPTLKVTNSGKYSVTVTIGPCQDSDEINMFFKTPPSVKLMDDDSVCLGDRKEILGTFPAGLGYSWNTGEHSPTIKVKGAGDYILTVTDAPCEVSDTFHLKVNPLPITDLKDTMICPTDSAYLNTFCVGCAYQWNTGETAPSIWAEPGSLHTVTVTSDRGCKWEPTVHVWEDKTCPDELYIPNAFTPNNDGVNDLFKVYVGNNVTLHEVRIYNRWGELVYRFTNPEGGWDGKYLGELCESTLYNVRVIYSNVYRVKKSISGHVSLLK